MQLFCWIATSLLVLDVLAQVESTIVRRQIRRIVKRLDRNTNDLIDQVKESLEDEDHKPRRERKPEGRRRGRSRSRSREPDGLTSLARPILRQVLRAKNGILGNVGVQANLDNGKWNVNLKIGGRKPSTKEDHGEGEKRGEEHHGYRESDIKLNTLEGEGLNFKNEAIPSKGRLNFEWPGAAGGVQGHFTHNPIENHATYSNGKMSIGTGYQTSSWQPPAGYTTGQAAPAEWLRKSSSEREDGDWSLESKEEEIFTPLGKTTSTKQPPTSRKANEHVKRSKASTESEAVYEETSSSEEKSRGRAGEHYATAGSFLQGQDQISATPVPSLPQTVWTAKPWNSASTATPLAATEKIHVPALTVNTDAPPSTLKWSLASPGSSHDWLKSAPKVPAQFSDGWTPISRAAPRTSHSDDSGVRSLHLVQPAGRVEKHGS